jgi:hypothetical protein
MPFKEIITPYSENGTKSMNSQCGKKEELPERLHMDL